MSRLDWAAVGKGALVAGAIALVAGLVQRTLPERSSLSGLLFLVILLAMALGGYLAGSPQPRAALTAGAFAGLVASAALQLVNVVVGLARGTLGLASIATVVLAVLIGTSAASLGGYVAFRRSASGEPEGEVEP